MSLVVQALVIILVIALIFMLIRSLPVIRMQGPLAPVVWILLLLVVLACAGHFMGWIKL